MPPPQPVEIPKETFCGRCNAPGATIRCPQCQNTAWCTIECQKKDWLTHKGTCRERVEVKGREWEAPPVPQRPDPVYVSADDVWHDLPQVRCICSFGSDGHQQFKDIQAGDAQWNNHVGDASKPRVQGRVSVIVPTMDERYCFHPQLWLCFFSQTYVDKELIVVDSGEFPSPFFSSMGDSPAVKYVHVKDPLSAGEKRNIAIRQYASGEIIANFDDDDLYFPAYLQTMVKVLKVSKSAVVHLSAWNVLDVSTGFCGTFNRAKQLPSESEATELAFRSGFSMVYTHAAWRCIPWAQASSGEDAAWLHACTRIGLPITSRAESGRALTVLHLQHGMNMGTSTCTSARADSAAISTMIVRFDQACRRIIGVSEAEYDAIGECLLYRGLQGITLTKEMKSPKGAFLLEDAKNIQEYYAWRDSGIGLHPDRDQSLGKQLAHIMQEH